MSAPVFGSLPDDAELRKLVAACCNGAATPEEWRRLDGLIVAHPEVAEFYLSYVAMCAHLRHVLGGPLDVDEASSGNAIALPTGAHTQPPARRKLGRGRRWLLAGSVAAVLVVAVSSLAYQVGLSSRAKPVVAWLEQTPVGSEDVPLRSGDRVRQPEGRTDLRFDNGVRLTLSGNADLELISPMSVRLHSGQLQADVGESGRGFRVLTDSTDVLDLGTVFGVGVKPSGETDVVVFQGEVELSRSERDSRGPADRRYTTGEAVRVESGGDRTRIPVIWQGATSANWSSETTFAGSSLITSVSDNLSTASRPKFYAIVPGGFREEARAYADRIHTWTGLGDTGLPDELLGGDYIQTFIDDRAETDLELRVTVARPARIYVLVDDRVRAPEWVMNGFAETGLHVALSVEHAAYRQAPYFAESESHPVFGGRMRAGRWQFPFSVWVREARDERELRFGAPSLNYTGAVEVSGMYGIVIAPLKGP